MAALVAEEFKLDPIIVLKSDVFDWHLREAAYTFIQEQKAAEHERNKPKR